MSHTQIDFLDTTVKFGPDRELITTLYNKPTDTHLYLEHSSAHHQSVLTKGPYGQYLRLRRICSLDIDFEANAKKVTGYYLKRGYPFPSLKKHYHKKVRLYPCLYKTREVQLLSKTEKGGPNHQFSQ